MPTSTRGSYGTLEIRKDVIITGSNNGYLQLFSDTVAYNNAIGGAGGGIYQGSDSSSRTSACIVALNNRGGTYTKKDDFFGVPHGNSGDGRSLFSSKVPAFTHDGYSDLVVTGFTLPALADNGGPTLTHAITASSEAYDADRSSPARAYRAEDQRSANGRPRGNYYDLGAFEL